MDIKAAVDLVGSFGPYQVIHYLAIAVTYSLPSSWQLISIVFIGFSNGHLCQTELNVSLSDALPVELGPDGKERYSQCLMYSEHGNNLSDQLPCTDGWQYDPGTFDPEDGTITIEWDLVCERSRYVELPVILFNIGGGLGYLILCPFGDRFGRRNVLFLCQILTAVTGVAMAFSPSFVVFCVFRVLVGFPVSGVFAEGNILLAELLPTRLRPFASLSPMFDSIGCASVALWAYFFRSWRQLQLWTSVAGTVALVYYWWCPESLIWLASRNNKKQLIKQLQSIARFNKTPITVAKIEEALQVDLTVVADGNNHVQTSTLEDTDKDGSKRIEGTGLSDDIPAAAAAAHEVSCEGMIIVQQHNSQTDEQPRAKLHEVQSETAVSKSEWQNFKHFLRIPAVRRYYFIMTYSMFAASTSYVSLILMSGYLHGDIYVNVAITNLVEVPGVIMGVFLMLRFGRRVPCVTMELATAVLLGLAAGLSAMEGAATSVTVLTIFARTTWAAAWAIKLIYSQEIVPTSIRSTSFGIGICASSIGGMVAPYLSLYLLGVRTWLPPAILCGLHLLCGSLHLLVPETLGRELPSTPEEVAAWPISLTHQEKLHLVVQWKRIWDFKKKCDTSPKEDVTSSQAIMSPLMQL